MLEDEGGTRDEGVTENGEDEGWTEDEQKKFNFFLILLTGKN
jgi:hypothetical protein